MRHEYSGGTMADRILLADEQTLFLEGLESLFLKFSDYEIVGTVDNGSAIVEKVKELKPDVVILDIILKRLNGIEATRRLLQEVENLKIIALTMRNDRQTVIQAFRAGVHGYLLKTCSHQELFKAITTIRSNRAYLTTQVMDVVLDDFRVLESEKIDDPISDFSRIEREIMQLCAEGNTDKQIARQLHIGEDIVAIHRKSIYQKLNLFNIADLKKYSIRNGLTSL
jgi:DNA-binding NarL/FixJ family response regulator